MVNDPNKIRYYLERAVYESKTGRPGPSWLDIPLDVQAAEVVPERLEPFIPSQSWTPRSWGFEEIAALYKVSEWLRFCKRPVIIAGHGIRLSQGEGGFVELVEALKIPVVSSKLGFDLLSYDNPYYIGPGGTKGTRAANLAIQNADLVIALGSRLAIPFVGYEYDLFAREAIKVAVDIDINELNKETIELDLAIHANVVEFMPRLFLSMSGMGWTGDSNWLRKCQVWKAKYPVVTKELISSARPLSIYDFFDKLADSADPGAVVVADAGTSYFVVTQAFKVKPGQRVLVPAALGTMGLSLPLAIGAYYAAPGKQIIAVTGDGSLQMNIQELQTVAHNKIPIKLFVINNGEYASIRNTQNSYFGGRLCGADALSGVSCPNLSKIAFAYGIPYERLNNPGSLAFQLSAVLTRDGPIIAEVFTDPNQQIIPAVSSRVLPDGRMVSSPLEDMWPFLPKEELLSEMIVKPVDYGG
jgi:acetolactate synthase-1/2/3 large subunit